jgi:hypothetical protein
MRLIKVGIKHIFLFHPRYLLLFNKNNLISSKQKINVENIFIITSCLNPDDNKNYFNHNSSNKNGERLQETLKGIASIRNNFPNAYIILLENSYVSDSESNPLQVAVDKYFNYNEDNKIKISRKYFNKGVPQLSMLIKFCEENYDKYHAEVFHIISARYQIKENISSSLLESGSYFLFYREYKNVSTRYYFFKKISLITIMKSFRKTLFFAIFGNSIEDVLFMFVPEFKIVKELKITGMISGIQLINE